MHTRRDSKTCASVVSFAFTKRTIGINSLVVTISPAACSLTTQLKDLPAASLHSMMSFGYWIFAHLVTSIGSELYRGVVILINDLRDNWRQVWNKHVQTGFARRLITCLRKTSPVSLSLVYIHCTVLRLLYAIL